MAMRTIRLRTLMIAVAAAGLLLGIEVASRDMHPEERRDLLLASIAIAVVGVPFAAFALSTRLHEPAPLPPGAFGPAGLVADLCAEPDPAPAPGPPHRDDPAPGPAELLARWAARLWLAAVLTHLGFVGAEAVPGPDAPAVVDEGERTLYLLVVVPCASMAAVATLSWVGLLLVGHVGGDRRPRPFDASAKP